MATIMNHNQFRNIIERSLNDISVSEQLALDLGQPSLDGEFDREELDISIQVTCGVRVFYPRIPRKEIPELLAPTITDLRNLWLNMFGSDWVEAEELCEKLVENYQLAVYFNRLIKAGELEHGHEYHINGYRIKS
ncbi:MAG TPA: hypothetical protein PLQ34_07705 [Ferrovaceae bacterium]|jgi:hypothetical protein|nr:hypothetical protein [Ferrovaceae bacterium]